MVRRRVEMRIRSSRATSSGPSIGRNESAASNCGNSLTGVRTRSLSQSTASVPPASVSRYTVRVGRLPSRSVDAASMSPCFTSESTTEYSDPKFSRTDSSLRRSRSVIDIS